MELLNQFSSLELYPSPVRSTEPYYSKWRVKMRKKLFERFLPGHDFKTSIVDKYKTASGTRKKRRRRLKLSKPTRRRR